MKRAAGVALTALLACAGCISQKEVYAPDMDRRPLDIDGPTHLKTWLKMNDPTAPLHFMRDVKNMEGHTWRWTGKTPTLMLAAPSDRGVKFAANITVAEATFKDTGPVVIKVGINGQELTTERYDVPGPKRIEKPVPDGWLKTGRDNVVSMDVDKVWTSPIDGNQLGFVLTDLGFIP